MARYRATDAAERRTAGLTIQFTPTERKHLGEAAERSGAPIGEYVRQLCLRRGAQPRVVAGTQRNPAAKALADELRAIGINLNQLTRVANQTGELRRVGELSRLIDELKTTMRKVITL